MRILSKLPFEIAPDVPLSRWITALFIAIGSDVASFVLSLTAFLQIGIDIFTAIILLLVFGWNRILFIALIFEAIPVISMFPTWTLLIIVMKVSGNAGWKRERPKTKSSLNSLMYLY